MMPAEFRSAQINAVLDRLYATVGRITGTGLLRDRVFMPGELFIMADLLVEIDRVSERLEAYLAEKP